MTISRTKDKKIYIFIAVFIILAAMSLYNVVRMIGSVYDIEYVFQRITNELPEYSTNANWLLVDRTDLTSPLVNDTKYNLEFTQAVWDHPPLPNYIMYPISKVIDLNKPSIERMIPLILMLITVLLIADVIRRKFNWVYASLGLLPFIFSRQLLGSGMVLYYDCFMWLFFGISFWLIVVKPKYWNIGIWISLCAMILSKEIGLLLLPIIMIEGKSWKYALAGLIYIPYLTWVASANGWNFLYIPQRWIEEYQINASASGASLKTSISHVFSVFAPDGLWTYFAFTIIGFISSIIISIKNKTKEYLSLITFYAIALFYGLVWGQGYQAYQLFSILYGGIGMVAIEFKWLSQFELGKNGIKNVESTK